MRRTLSPQLLVGVVAGILGAAAYGCGSTPPSAFTPPEDGGAPPLTGSGGDAGGPLVPGDAGPLGSFADSGVDPCGHEIKAVFRDFEPSADPGGHPDFERDDYVSEDDNGTPGLVKADLGADGRSTRSPGARAAPPDRRSSRSGTTTCRA